MSVSDWSTTAASNNAAPPNGAPEGMAPSAVNDVIRQMMADIKAFWDLAARSTATSYTLNGALTTDNTTADEAGFKGIPQNLQNANYTCVLSDAGKQITTTSTGGYTHTIPANASVAYPIGTVLTFINYGAANTIAITSDTLRLAGTSSTGSRTLAGGGLATAVKTTATEWLISGAGLS
jgi:hypothetical protein